MAFKAARLSESVLESQDEVITRNLEREEAEKDNDKQALDDIGYNADLHIFLIKWSFKNNLLALRLTVGWCSMKYNVNITLSNYIHEDQKYITKLRILRGIEYNKVLLEVQLKVSNKTTEFGTRKC